jgi:hypothetical protein
MTLPFLLMFVGGYYWAGFATLWQEYKDRQRHNLAQRAELESAFETAT